MTLFSYEVPLQHLRDFEPYQDYTFALSFLLEDQTYADYVSEKCMTPSEIVYIDNGFNELSVPASPDAMANLYSEFYPTCIAAPDADWWTTAEVATAFDALARRVPLHSILGIFRTENQLDYLTGRGCKHLAIPFEWRDRVQYNPSTTHFLGLGNLHDVISGQPPTLDTSKPIKMALAGIRFEDWAAKGIYTASYHPDNNSVTERFARFREYLNTKLTTKQLDLAISNIHALRAAVHFVPTA